MKRRNFLTLIGASAAAWPMVGHSEQGTVRLIGFVHSGSADANGHLTKAFRNGLADTGFTEGKNIGIEYRWANGHYDQLPFLVTDLIARKVELIAAPSLPAALAAKAATTTLPIVFNMGADPVAMGLVTNLARPGGNITGISSFFGALGGKRLELLRELLPRPATVGVLVNTSNPNAEAHLSSIETVARAVGQKLEVRKATTADEIAAAFMAFVQQDVGALLVSDDPFFTSMRDPIIALAARHNLPAIYYFRDFVAAGGLASYGSSAVEVYYQTGVYAGRILKGAKPADLPILQPTKFEMVVNLKTAKALGLVIPPSILARVDEIIE